MPQMPITQHDSPAIMPNPTDISIGPSAFSADPNENRLVRKWNPKTASKTTPKITQVVGCVNAAAIAIRNSAVRAPHDVRAACEERDRQAQQEQHRDVVQVADVRRREEQRDRRQHRHEDHDRVAAAAEERGAEREPGEHRDPDHEERAEGVPVDAGDPLQQRARRPAR